MASLHEPQETLQRVGSAVSEERDQSDEHSMWSRAFVFGHLKLRVEEEWGESIGGTIWEGGVLLARYLSCTAVFPPAAHAGQRCIELGAGVTGLPSLVAAHLGCFAEVVITDIDECIEGLTENVTNNLSTSCLQQAMSGPATHCLRQPVLARPGSVRFACDGPALQQGLPNLGSVDQQAAEDHADNATSPPAAVASSACSRDQDAVVSALDSCRITRSDEPALITQSAHQHDGSAQALDPSGQSGSCPGATLAQHGSPASIPAASDGQQPQHGAASARQQPGIHSLVDSQATLVRIEELDWRESVAFLDPPYDVLLVADVVYAVELMEALLQCMAALCTPQTKVILAYYERSAAAGREFWALMPDYFTWKKVPEDMYGAPPHADDIGIFILTKQH